MSSERVCYFHVGTGKTGTSAVQYALAVSRRYLLENEMDFPNLTGNMRQILGGFPTCGNGQSIFACLDRGDMKGAQAVIENYSPTVPSFVVSSEGFGWLPRKSLSWLVEKIRERGYTVKCCVCFRPQADYIASAYLQLVKSAKADWRQSMDDYAQKAINNGLFEAGYNWLTLADRLAGVFGAENMTVLWYPQLVARGRNGVVNAVFEWLGLSTPAIPGMAPYVNPSPNREAAHVLRMLNSTGLGGKELADVFLARAERRGLLDGKYVLEPAIAQRIDALTRNSNREMLRKYAGLTLEADVVTSRPENKASTLREEVLGELLMLSGRLLNARAGAVKENTSMLGKAACVKSRSISCR